jgi:hypothetical protein
MSITTNTDSQQPDLRMTMGGLSITADLLDIWAAEMKLKHADNELPEYMVRKLEALPGWTWFPGTAAAILAMSRVEADAPHRKPEEVTGTQLCFDFANS